MKQRFYMWKLTMICSLIFAEIILFPCIGQAQATEEKPKYAPGREKNRNK